MYYLSELMTKEVINIGDGTCYGFIEDLEVDLSTGRIAKIITKDNKKNSLLFSSNESYEIPLKEIKKIGDDVILIEKENEKKVENN